MVPVKTPLPPVQVYIITCDRPAAVERLLQSMANSSAPACRKITP